MPPRRRAPADPVAAQETAKTAAAAKAERAPRTLTAADVALLPGRKVLELGNQGHLRHLGVGTRPLAPATPATSARTSQLVAKRGASTTRARTGRRSR